MSVISLPPELLSEGIVANQVPPAVVVVEAGPPNNANWPDQSVAAGHGESPNEVYVLACGPSDISVSASPDCIFEFAGHAVSRLISSYGLMAWPIVNARCLGSEVSRFWTTAGCTGGVTQSADMPLLVNVWGRIAVRDASPEEVVLSQKFGELGKLEKGWLDGEGEPVESETLTASYNILSSLLREGVPLPRVFPTPEGGVQAEWTSGQTEMSLTLEAEGALYAVAVDTISGEFTEREGSNVAEILRFVRTAFGRASG